MFLPISRSLFELYVVHSIDALNTSITGPCRSVFLNSLSKSESVGAFIGCEPVCCCSSR